MRENEGEGVALQDKATPLISLLRWCVPSLELISRSDLAEVSMLISLQILRQRPENES